MEESSPSLNGPSPTFTHSQHHLNQLQNENLQNLNLNSERNRPTSAFYRLNIYRVGSIDARGDLWSCMAVLITFWFFASMTMILGFYGSVTLELGPNCSRLIQANSFFVHSIKAQEVNNEPRAGSTLYGFYKRPPLNVEVTWSETHEVSLVPNVQKEWIYFLNRGSQVNISYNVTSPSAIPLSLVISQGRESLIQWINHPSYPNTTLSWNVIHGNGRVQQKIWKSSDYYVAVGNLNFEEVKVQLNFTMKAFQYSMAQKNYKCSIGQHLCAAKLLFLRRNVAVIASRGPEHVNSSDLLCLSDSQNGKWRVTVSYGPRWITYIVGSGLMTVLILLAFRMSKTSATDRARFPNTLSEHQTPLILHKDDLLSLGSSYDSGSQDDDLEVSLIASALEGKPLTEGENSKNPRRVCVICFDASRDCFFLPCGHCATCFACGTRIAEEAGRCPVCSKNTKKVRRIFTV